MLLLHLTFCEQYEVRKLNSILWCIYLLYELIVF